MTGAIRDKKKTAVWSAQEAASEGLSVSGAAVGENNAGLSLGEMQSVSTGSTGRETRVSSPCQGAGVRAPLPVASQVSLGTCCPDPRGVEVPEGISRTLPRPAPPPPPVPTDPMFLGWGPLISNW